MTPNPNLTHYCWKIPSLIDYVFRDVAILTMLIINKEIFNIMLTGLGCVGGAMENGIERLGSNSSGDSCIHFILITMGIV